jgi:hypothetical protein
MVKLRIAVATVALCTGVTGCALHNAPSNIAHYSIWHCDECDDFPTPGYGPNFSMVPGSYTQPPAPGMTNAKPPASDATNFGTSSPPGQTPAAPPPPQTPAAAPPATITPPIPPAAASPGLGGNLGQPASGGVSPNPVAAGTTGDLPPLSAGT